MPSQFRSQLFNLLDIQKKGFISPKDLRTAFQLASIDTKPEWIDDMFDKMARYRSIRLSGP